MIKFAFFFMAALMILQLPAAERYRMEFCGKRTRLFEKNKEITFVDCLTEQMSRRGESQLRDLVKQAYQGAYGAGHAVINKEQAWRYFCREFSGVTPEEKAELFEIISPDYCRVNLAKWKAEKLPGKCFPQFSTELAVFLRHYRGGAVHHSLKYRQFYHPSYRIISTRFLTVIPVLKAAAKLPGNGVKVIAIDGRAASGKTTAAKLLAEILKTGIIHMDDFFLPQDLRTPTRLAEAGGNVHYERFKLEVLPDLRKESGLSYRKFDCSKNAPGELREIGAAKWRIVEGAYSLHPEFGNYADLKVFFDIAPAEQVKRIRKRNGEKKMQMFLSRWIPMEEYYIKQTALKKRVDIILGGEY